MEIFIKSEDSLHELAKKIRQILNIGDTNVSSWIKEQYRDSINYGGEYYRFEVLGFELCLLSNKGEVEIEEQDEYPYFIVIEGAVKNIGNECSNKLALHISNTLSEKGIETLVDDKKHITHQKQK